MPETVGANIKFKIELISSDGNIYDDLQYVAFVRTPIIKQASFCVIQASLPIVVVRHLQNLLASNIQDIWKMCIYTIDETEQTPHKCIFDKYIQILSVQEQEVITYTKNECLARLLVVNPILQTLETTTAFNKVLSDVTALEAIEEYENFLDETYGEFNYEHVGTSEEVNTFRYEQIFIPPTVNTLNVPKYIINTYKPFHSYSFYFFDDFYVTEESENEITAHFINLANAYNQLVRFDVAQYADYARLSRKLSTKDFTDPFRLLDKDQFTSIIFRTKDIVGGAIKQFQSLVMNISSASATSTEVIDKNIKTPISQLQLINRPQSIRASIIYVPDNEKNAKRRLEVARDLMFNKFERMVIFETDTCLPYWMHFGYIYNMEVDNAYEYQYTPIGITNVFRRDKVKDETVKMIHTCRFIMLKVIPESEEYKSLFIAREPSI